MQESALLQEFEDKPSHKREFFTFIVASLKGVSQVMLIENAITGFIMLLAITTFSYTLGIISLLSACIGTFIAKIGGADEQAVNQGLFGFNSVLTGIALTLFLTEPYNWIIALIGAGVVAILTAALMHFIQSSKIPILTFPFVIFTWFTLLISYKFEGVYLDPTLVPQVLSSWNLDSSGDVNWLAGFLKGIAQIFFLNNIYSGILLFIAIFWAGWKFGVYAIIANIVGILTAFALGGELTLISVGLYGYNAILTIIAVSIVFKAEHNRFALASGIIGACLTVPITASLSIWLLPYGIPALTMAFVLSAWIFLAARQLMPKL